MDKKITESLTQTDIKISLEECNSMPAREAMLESLAQHGINNYKIVDLPVNQAPYWQNDEMTLVIALSPDDFPNGALAGFVHDVSADEYDYRMVDGYLVVRLWWD